MPYHFAIFSLLLCVAFGDIVNDIKDSMDTGDRSALDSILNDLETGYITDATTVNDLRTLIDDAASALDLDSDTVDALESAIASILDSGNEDRSVSSHTCHNICEQMELVCGDSENTVVDDYLSGDCIDQCKDEWYEHRCYCCLKGVACENHDPFYILGQFCSESLFGYCNSLDVQAVGDCSLDLTPQDAALIPSDSSMLPDSDNIVREIYQHMDTTDHENVESLVNNYGTSYIDDAETMSDIQSLVDDIASVLNLGSGTVDELEDALASVLNSDNPSLSESHCEHICDDFADLCDDTDSSGFYDWLEDTCVDSCKENAKQHSCQCCSENFDCNGEDIQDLLDERCKRSISGACMDDRHRIGDCFIEELIQKAVDIRLQENTAAENWKFKQTIVIIGVVLMWVIIIGVTLLTLKYKKNGSEGEIQTNTEKMEIISGSDRVENVENESNM